MHITEQIHKCDEATKISDDIFRSVPQLLAGKTTDLQNSFLVQAIDSYLNYADDHII